MDKYTKEERLTELSVDMVGYIDTSRATKRDLERYAIETFKALIDYDNPLNCSEQWDMIVREAYDSDSLDRYHEMACMVYDAFEIWDDDTSTFERNFKDLYKYVEHFFDIFDYDCKRRDATVNMLRSSSYERAFREAVNKYVNHDVPLKRVLISIAIIMLMHDTWANEMEKF